MKDAVIMALLALSLGANGLLWSRTTSGGEAHEPELAESMAHLQRYSHKLTLAVRGQNAEVASFYLHELEEVTEAIQKEIPVYEGHKVAELAGSMLMPQIEAMEQAIEAGDWNRGTQLIQSMAEACNSCHQATAHAFIRIEVATGNPYGQTF